MEKEIKDFFLINTPVGEQRVNVKIKIDRKPRSSSAEKKPPRSERLFRPGGSNSVDRTASNRKRVKFEKIEEDEERQIKKEEIETKKEIREESIRRGLELENKSLKKQTRELQTELFDKEKEINGLKFERNELSLKLEDFMDSQAEKSQEKKYNRYLDKIQDLINARSPDIQKIVELALVDRQADLEELPYLKKKIKDQEKEIEGLLNKNETRLNVPPDMRNYVRKLEEKIKNLESEVQGGDKNLSSMRKRMEAAFKERDDQIEKNNFYRESLEKNEKRAANWEAGLEEQREEGEVFKIEREKLLNQIQNSESKTQFLEKQREDLESQIENSRKRIFELEENYDQLLKKYWVADRYVGHFRGRLEDMKQVLVQVVEQLELEGDEEKNRETGYDYDYDQRDRNSRFFKASPLLKDIKYLLRENQQQEEILREKEIESLQNSKINISEGEEPHNRKFSKYIEQEPQDHEYNFENVEKLNDINYNPPLKFEELENHNKKLINLLQKEQTRYRELRTEYVSLEQKILSQVQNNFTQPEEPLLSYTRRELVPPESQTSKEENFVIYENESIRVELSKLQNERHRWTFERESLIKDLSKVKQELEQTQEEADLLHFKLETALREKEELEYEIENQRQQSYETQSRFAEDESKVYNLERELMSAREQVSYSQTNERMIEKKNQIIKKQCQDLEEKNARLVELTNQLSQKSAVITQLNQKLVEYENEMEQREQEFSDSISELSYLRTYKKELEKKNREILEQTESKFIILEKKDLEYKNEITDLNQNLEKLQEIIAKYELEAIKREKILKKLQEELSYTKDLNSQLEAEIKDTRVNMDQHVKEKTKNFDSVRKKLKESEARLIEVEEDKKDLRNHFENESEKLVKLNSQALKMLEDQNNKLEEKLEKEAQKRYEEASRWKEREASYIKEITRANEAEDDEETNTIISFHSRIEEDLRKREHELVDLTAELDKSNRENENLKRKISENSEKILSLEKDNAYLTKRKKELLDKLKLYQAVEAIGDKNDIEIIKEVNDLKEKVYELKDQRDKAIEEIRASTSLEGKTDFESEAMLDYIRQLIIDKKKMGEELNEREERLNSLSKNLATYDSSRKLKERELDDFKAQLDNAKEELAIIKGKLQITQEDLSRHQQLLNRQINEAKTETRAFELKESRLLQENDNLKNSIKELRQMIDNITKENKQSAKLQTEIAKLQKENFISVINEIEKNDKSPNSVLENYLVQSSKIVHVKIFLYRKKQKLKS